MADNNQSTAEFATAVDEYLTRSYDGDRRRKILETGGWDPGFATELADLGWYALAVPEIYGGLGAPLSELGTVFAQFGRHLATGPLLENVLLPALLLRLDGSELSPPIAAAVETGIPLALVDAGVTADWSADLGSVTLHDHTLAGTVNAVRFAGQASLLVVVAEATPGLAVCLVDAAAAGVHIEEVDSADPATEFARVTFNEVHAEAAAFGPAAEALVTRIRSWARLLIACELSGVAHRSLERTIEYLSQRRQFDRPIGSFQAVKHIAADMHTRWAGLHNLCVASLDNADHASAADLDILAATAKAHAARTAILICEDAIQLHGGMGFTTESDVSWYYKRALALRSWYGDDTELQLKVGTALLHIAPATTTTDSGRDNAPAQVGGRK